MIVKLDKNTFVNLVNVTTFSYKVSASHCDKYTHIIDLKIDGMGHSLKCVSKNDTHFTTLRKILSYMDRT